MNFSEYWPDYLREHSKPATRAMHYIQTVFGGLTVLYCLGTQNWLALLVTLFVIFFWALAAHKLVEGNSPAAAIHPFWWSVVNDVRMFFHFVTGTLGAELRKAGVSAIDQTE